MDSKTSDLLVRWADEAHKAFEHGYYLQSVIIDLNLINHFIRDAIHSYAHHQTMELTGSSKVHPYLEDLIFNTRNKLTGGISDRALYKEASRLKLISDNLYRELDGLYKRRNLVLHRLFSEEYVKKESDNRELLQQLATDYRNVCIKCIQLATELMAKTETLKKGVSHAARQKQKHVQPPKPQQQKTQAQQVKQEPQVQQQKKRHRPRRRPRHRGKPPQKAI